MLTTAMLFSTVLHPPSSDSCSQCCLLPRVWSLAFNATSTSHRHCMIIFTGCWYHSAPPSKFRWCLTVLTANVWSTLVMCTFLYTLLLHVRDYDQWTMLTSLSHACGQLVFAAAVFVCVDRQFGKKLPPDLWSTDIREQYKRSLKSWLFEYAYSRRHVW